MNLRHFLYGKETSTDDFLTLVKSSGMAGSELMFWEARIGALIRELRDHGVPGDFMRLLITGQRATQWAYVRVRTGGDRARFDFQAVLLNSEELDWLGWQPWVLDSVLFNNNTYDQRVQEAVKRDSMAQSGREYNPPVVDIKFNEREIKPLRLTASQKEIVDKIITALGDANAPDTRWYFDAGRHGKDEGRHIIAGVLSQRREMGQKVPGFMMGLTSVRGNGGSIGAAYQNDGRFADIRLASYRKDPDGSFPFENWRDAEADRSPLPLLENLPSRATVFRGGRIDNRIQQMSHVELDRNDVQHTPPAWIAGGSESGIITDSAPLRSPLPTPAFNNLDHDRPFSYISEQIRAGLDRLVPLKFFLVPLLVVLICSFAVAYLLIQRAGQKHSDSEYEIAKINIQETQNKSPISSSEPTGTASPNNNMKSSDEERASAEVAVDKDLENKRRDIADSKRDDRSKRDSEKPPKPKKPTKGGGNQPKPPEPLAEQPGNPSPQAAEQPIKEDKKINEASTPQAPADDKKIEVTKPTKATPSPSPRGDT